MVSVLDMERDEKGHHLNLTQKFFRKFVIRGLIGGGGLNDLRVDTMITKWEFGKSERTHHPPPT